MDKNDEIMRIEAHITRLDTQISTAEARGGDGLATLYFDRGRSWWKLGEKGKAISDYERAAAIDSESPAVEALELARRVMNFYHTDLYNP